jgi:hypothetical protein
MTCSVNLVPALRRHTRRRARRGCRWLGFGVGLCVLLATAWAAERTAASTLARLGDTVSALELRRTEVQRRLLLAQQQRTRLLEQLQTVAGARRPQLWPQRLVTLMRETPPGVFLTALHVDPPVVVEPAVPPPATQATAQTPDAHGHDGSVTPVRMVGYALNHDALLQFLHALQSASGGCPAWQHVELIRATQEPYQSGLLVAFELACRIEEERS